MHRIWPFLLISLFTGGCATTGTESDCGMYDFNCKDVPQGDALIEPDNNEVGGTSTQTNRASAAAAQPSTDLETRVRHLEAEVRHLRLRLDAME